MPNLEEQITKAIARAREELAKEQERDERGRFAGSGNDETSTGNGSKDLAGMAQDLKPVKGEPTGSADKNGRHDIMAAEHKELAESARAAGNKKAAEAHDKAATAHATAASQHRYALRAQATYEGARNLKNSDRVQGARSHARTASFNAATASRDAAEL